MCLRPIRIYNNVDRIYRNFNQRYQFDIPCGNCAECNTQKRNDWYVRSYYQCLDTFRKGGYIYFVTLTYRNEDLPMISDYVNAEPSLKEVQIQRNGLFDHSCFRWSDVRSFLMDLRQYLQYYYSETNTVKYFISGEYGTSSDRTHRPHYHCLFFVENSACDPDEFSRLVDRFWTLGRTDGPKYKDSLYVSKHIYRADTDLPTRMGICGYVTKYVTKDCEYQSVIDDRLEKIFNRLRDAADGYFPPAIKRVYRLMKKRISQTHHQSHGFGEYFIEVARSNKEVWDFMYNDGMIHLPDRKNIFKNVKVPGYYIRKIFYEQYINYVVDTGFEMVKDVDGNYRMRELSPEKPKLVLGWRLNEDGRDWWIHQTDRKIRLTVKKYKNWFINLPGYSDEDHGKGYYYTEVQKLLDGRSWEDFAQYILFYRGVVRSESSIRTGKPDSLDYMMNNYVVVSGDDFVALDREDIPYYRNYVHYTCKDRFGLKFITTVDIGNRERGYIPAVLNKEYDYESDSYGGSLMKYLKKYGDAYTPESFYRYFCYNSGDGYIGPDDISPAGYFNVTVKPCYEFRGYDEIIELYQKTSEYRNRQKQEFYEWREGIVKRLKRIYGSSSQVQDYYETVCKDL